MCPVRGTVLLYTPFLIHLELNSISSPVRGTVYTHFVYTVPHIPRSNFFKVNSISSPVRGTVYTHFVYTVPHIPGVAFFKAISSPVRGTVYTHFVYTVPHIPGFPYLVQIHILYTPYILESS